MLFSSLLLLMLTLQLTRVASIRRLPTDGVGNVNNGSTNNTTTAAAVSDKTAHFRHLKKSVTVPTPSSREDHRVTFLPYLANNTFLSPHYAGLLPANAEKTKYLFYWLFEAEPTTNVDVDKVPLVVWLNGGPGCSSMDGLFLEHGPFQIVLNGNADHDDTSSSSSWEIRTNPHSWHTAPAHVVYLDQPVGTGLSFTTTDQYPSNDQQVNQDFHYWLQQFLILHGDLFLNDDDHTALKVPLFFTGESHAGHYIPSMMNYIHHQNDNNNNNNIYIRIDGAAIGNGWVDPYHQYAGAEAAYGHGLIDLSQKYALDEKEKKCQQHLASGNWNYGTCFALLDDIVSQSQGKHGLFQISQYNARTWEKKARKRVFPPGHERVESYLGGWPTPDGDPKMNNNDGVLEAIHATYSQDAGQRYQECTDPPYNALSHQDGLGVVDDVVALLDDKTKVIRLLFFNGMDDLICNHVGTEITLLNLPYSKRNDYIQAPRYSWSFQNSVVGYVKEHDNLQYLKVLNSGHMVPLDLPEVALEMMRNFLFQRSFQSSEQDLVNAEDNDACPVCPTCNNNNATTNANNIDNPTSGLAYIVAHSWIAAMVAVVLFLGAFVFVRNRQGTTTNSSSVGGGPSYGNLEMKEGGTYRDEAVYRDDPSETNGNGII